MSLRLLIENLGIVGHVAGELLDDRGAPGQDEFLIPDRGPRGVERLCAIDIDLHVPAVPVRAAC